MNSLFTANRQDALIELGLTVDTQPYALNPMYRLRNLAPDIHAVRVFLEKTISADVSLENLKVAWVKHNPQEDLRLLYKAEGRGGESCPLYFFARTLPETSGRKWEEKINRQFVLDIKNNAILKIFRKAAVYDPDLNLLFQIFPADRRLPFLVKAADAKVMKPILEEHIDPVDGRTLSAVAASAIQYKPERKCLIRYQLDWHDAQEPAKCVYGKVYRKVNRVYPGLQKIYRAWHNPRFRIPKPLGMVPDLSLELIGHVPGTHLSLMCREKTFPETCRQIGHGLCEFHEFPVRLNETRDLSVELLEMKSWSENFVMSLPKLGERIRKSISMLEMRLLGQERAQPRLVHGDFHVANILVEGERLSLLDFENCFMGNPAIDVGSFYAQLKLLSLKVFRKHAALDASIHAFLEAYMDGCCSKVRLIIPTYCALSCLWCAYFQCILRPGKSGWLPRAYVMIDLCERILDSGKL